MSNNMKLPLALGDLAKILKLELVGNPKELINNIQLPFDAKKGDISFVFNKEHIDSITRLTEYKNISFLTTQAIVGANCILCSDDEYKNKLKELFNLFERPEKCYDNLSKSRYGFSDGIVISDNVEIGGGTIINPHVTIYPEVVIGDGCIIHSGTVIRGRVKIGNNVIIGSNTTIGASGYQYYSSSDRKKTIQYTGKVLIKDYAIIGDNCSVESPKCGTTSIGSFVKIGNQVLICHGCSIGDYSRIAGNTSIAGDVTISNCVSIGGNVGISNGLIIGEGAQIISGSSVIKSVDSNSCVGGFFPSLEKNKFLRIYNLIKCLPDLLKKRA